VCNAIIERNLPRDPDVVAPPRLEEVPGCGSMPDCPSCEFPSDVVAWGGGILTVTSFMVNSANSPIKRRLMVSTISFSFSFGNP